MGNASNSSLNKNIEKKENLTKKNNEKTILSNTNTNKEDNKEDSKSKTIQKYSKEEVASHNKPEDCWCIINQSVYDITSLIDIHPGGLVILKFIGKDCTKDFLKQHKYQKSVRKRMEDFKIGELLD